MIILNIYMFLGAILFLYIETCRNKKTESYGALNTTSNMTLKEVDIINMLPLVCSCGKLKITIQQQKNENSRISVEEKITQIFSTCNNSTICQSSIAQERCSFSFINIFGWVIFCWEAISTIGYGSKVLKSTAGKLLMIPYSMFGIAIVLAFFGLTGSILKSFILKCIDSFEKHVLKRDQVNHKECKVLIATTILTSMSNIVGAYIYSYTTNVDFITSIYFFYVTFSTIGFGDYNMNSVISHLDWNVLMSLFLWVGMVGTSTLLQATVDVISKKHSNS